MVETARIYRLENAFSVVYGQRMRAPFRELSGLDGSGLKRAYYRRAKLCHPDLALSRGENPSMMESLFRQLGQAYEELRAEFDAGLSLPLPEEAAAAARKAEDASARREQSRQTSRTASAPSAGSGRTRSPTGQPPSPRYESPNPAGERFYSGAIPRIRLRLSQYLYYSGRISWNSLVASLCWQYRNRPRLGDLGCAAGYLDRDKVLDVLRRKAFDENFGAACLRLGYLDERRLRLLLGKQMLYGMPIGRFFTEAGLLDEAGLARALEGLRRHNCSVRAG